MSYLVKVIVYAADDPDVLQVVRKAVEGDGATVVNFDVRHAGDGARELFVELLLDDARIVNGLIRRIEGVTGAAVMAATAPQKVRSSRGIKG